MKGLVLLLLAGVSLAAFPGDISRLENSADPRLKGYKPRNTYSYQYEACLTSGFPETEQQYAGLKITCDTEFFIESDSLAYLKIKNPKLYEVNGTTHDCSSDAIKISPVSEELALLLKQPIKFEYKDGKVGQIYCNKDEPEYILNIKRGILSVLHHNFTKPEIDDGEPRLYKNWENGSFGLCENIYDVQYIQPESTKIPKMKISKTLNLNNCTRTSHIFSNVPGIRCVNKNCSRVDEPLKTSILTSCDLLGKESNFVVKICETKSRYIFAPTQMKGSAATIVKQVLRFKEVKAQLESYEIVSNTPHTLEMTGFDKEDAHLTNQQRQEIVTKTIKLIELLIKSVHQKDWKGYKFTALVEMLRKGDRDTLTDIWDRCADVDQLRLWLLEALPFVYKKEVFELVADKICSRELRVHEAIPVLRGLALTKDPSERMCMDISDLCLHSTVQEDETLLGTCYLTQGALMYHYCKDKDVGCFSDKALELKNRLLTASYREKIFLVKSIGNFGHKSLYLPLLDIIQDTENTLELRVTAVYALRRIAAKVPQKVLPVLLKIFRDVHTDAELRMACFVVICDAKPGPAVFNLIVKQLNSERINQVRSFVVSSIKGMAFSRYPCDEKMAKLARIALKMIRRKTISFVPSKWLQWGEFSELVQLGGRADLQTIFTPSSFLPRAVTSKVKVHVLGRSVNLFETGVRGEGIQELLKPVVRPKEERRQEEPERRHGETADKKKLLNKLTRRNPYNKEVREMSKLLPIAEYEEEKAKGSFYFKVLGQELMYKYFTYDDVRELIEDGVISMNNDLKDILKKGKKFNLTKAFVPVEVNLVQPSVVGIPLKFVLQSVLFLRINTTVKAEVKPKFFIPLPEQVTVNGKINISVLHSTWGKMKICLPQLSTGSKMTLNINITTSLGGSVQYDLKQSTYNTELDLPRDAKQIFSTEKQGYTFLMYNKPVGGVKDWNSLYRSTPLDGLEIGDMTQIGQTQPHPGYANWTLKAQTGKYLSINEQNELTLSDKPTIFKVVFIGRNRQFVKLFVPGKGYVKVKPNSKGCLETVEDERYPKLFKISYVKRNRFIRLATVVFIHPIKSNPTEWTETTAPRNTEEVLLFKHMIEDMTPPGGYREKWRYITDLPLDDIPREDRLHPRHMKIVFITPDEGKVCLRPNKSDESVFTVKRLHTTTEELCYGEKVLGMDVCLSGEYVEPLVPHPPVFPFCGPKKFNITIRPGKNPAHKIQFKLGKGDRYDADYKTKTWKTGVHLVGTNPEKKIETLVTYDVRDMQSDVTIEMHNMLPWLKRICIISHVFNWSEAEFFLKFGENCEKYAVKTHVTIKEPGRRQLSVVTSYNDLPQPVMSILYKLFRALSKQYRDKLSNYWITRSDRNTVKFAVKLKTDQLVDLELTMPTRVLTMDDVRIKTDGFIPRGNPLMHVVALSTPVCSLDYDTFKTFDDVEFQYSLPRRCVHVLAKDCVNNTFMVLASKEAENTDVKIIEIFVDKQKIRVEYLAKGRYQIQVNGVVIDLPKKMFKLKSVATIVEVPEQEELHVLCENGLKVLIVRGIKVDIRVSPFFFNRTCGMCGDLNYEQYLDLKTPRGIPYTYPDKRKYGHLWMVPEDKCREGGCHFKKEYVKIDKDIEGNRYQCYPTTPVLRCFDDCQDTASKFTRFPMTCVKVGSKEAQKITSDIEERTIDLAGSEVYFYKDLPEHMGCVCKCGQ